MPNEDSRQTRRRFLTTSATLSATLALAGCSGDFSLSGDGGSDEEEDEEETEEEEEEEEAALSDLSGQYTLREGDGTDPRDRGLAKPVTFQGDSGDTVSITMTSDEFDTYLILEGPDGEIVTEDDDGASGLNSQIIWTLEQSGEYTIWCGSYIRDATGSFMLDVEEFGDADGSQSISYGTSQQYRLLEGDGTDPRGRGLAKPVTFRGDSGATVTITMTSNEFDTYLILADPNGNIVTEDDDGAGGLNSQITWTLEQSGQYTIWCGSYSRDSTGVFTLSLE